MKKGETCIYTPVDPALAGSRKRKRPSYPPPLLPSQNTTADMPTSTAGTTLPRAATATTATTTLPAATTITTPDVSDILERLTNKIRRLSGDVRELERQQMKLTKVSNIITGNMQSTVDHLRSVNAKVESLASAVVGKTHPVLVSMDAEERYMRGQPGKYFDLLFFASPWVEPD